MNKQTFTVLTIILLFLYGIGGLLVLGYKSLKPEKIIETKIVSKIESEVKKIKEEIPNLKIINDSKPRTLIVPTEIEYNTWAYYLNNINPEKIKNSSVDLVIIDTQKDRISFSKEQVDLMKTKPNTAGDKRHVFAYVSFGDAENYRQYWKKEWSKKKPTWVGLESKIWKGNYDISNLLAPEWIEISKSIIDDVVETGYDGILISGLKDTNKTTLKYLEEVVAYAKSKKSDIKILVQDLDSFAGNSTFISLIDGIVKQGLVYSEFSNGATGRKNPESKFRKSLNNLILLKSKEKDVFVVEYVNGKKWEEANKVIIENKFLGLSSTLRLIMD